MLRISMLPEPSELALDETTMAEVATDSYRSADGHTVAREHDSLTPNGNAVAGRWVLRNPLGEFIDFDQYRHDLFERNGFTPAY